MYIRSSGKPIQGSWVSCAGPADTPSTSTRPCLQKFQSRCKGLKLAAEWRLLAAVTPTCHCLTSCPLAVIALVAMQQLAHIE
jgi:hypothetical protein